MTAPYTLVDRVRDLARSVATQAGGTPAEASAADILQRLDSPLQVAIAGKVKAGKSTLLNALIGERLAPTDASECTRIVTWYRRGEATQVTLVPHEGASHPIAFQRNPTLDVSLGDHTPETVHELLVDWPTERLQTMTLVDTPGIASLSPTLTQRTTAFLDPASDEPSRVDAVLYLMRHLHTDDARLLETFHDRDVAQPTPINCLGVLSRADEIGVARLDAMTSARAIADRYLAQPSIRRLCQNVVPVAGLLAETAVTLREVELTAFRVLAGRGNTGDDGISVSVHKFLAEDETCPLSVDQRRFLLDRFGLFGVRASLRLVSSGKVETAVDLSGMLQQLSGLTELRRQLAVEIGARADVLKARSALQALRRLAEGDIHQWSALVPAVEQLEAGGHELNELRLLTAVRLRAVPLPDAALLEAEQLMGTIGQPVTVRLGLEDGAGPREVNERLTGSLQRWHERAEDPLSSAEATHASSVVIRSLESLAIEVARNSQQHPSTNTTTTPEGANK
jgi:hypothetical protein